MLGRGQNGKEDSSPTRADVQGEQRLISVVHSPAVYAFYLSDYSKEWRETSASLVPGVTVHTP